MIFAVQGACSKSRMNCIKKSKVMSQPYASHHHKQATVLFVSFVGHSLVSSLSSYTLC